jgi:hypothetical protein
MDGLVEPSLKARAQIEAQYHAFKLIYSPALYWKIKGAFRLLSSVGIGRGNYTLAAEEASDTEISEEFGWACARRVRRRAERGIAHIEKDAAHSRALQAIYAAAIPDAARIARADSPGNVLARFPIMIADKDRVLSEAMRRNIEVSDWYATPVHPFPADGAHAAKYVAGSCPNAEKMARMVVSMPTNRKTSAARARHIIKEVLEIMAAG